MIEAMTGGLAGFGRADPPEGGAPRCSCRCLIRRPLPWAAAFTRQFDPVARCLAPKRPAPGVERVRLPGEAGWRARREHLRDGVPLHPSIMPALRPLALDYGVPLPDELSPAGHRRCDTAFATVSVGQTPVSHGTLLFCGLSPLRMPFLVAKAIA